MKPYEVTIFDRKFNFEYSTIIDFSELEYNRDLVTPEKSTVRIPTDYDPTESIKGYYIRINGNGEEYQGVITSFARGAERSTVTYSDPVAALNLNMLIAVAEHKTEPLETYIRDLIRRAVLNNDDPEQVMYGLTSVIASGTTSGALPYADTSEEYVTVNLLTDIIYPAFNAYGIVTKVTIDFEAQTIAIRVGATWGSARTIEADLPSVSSSSFTFKATKAINKINMNDIHYTPPSVVNYYLHGDGSWDTDPNTDRIAPVVNTVQTFDGWKVTKNIVDVDLSDKIDRFKTLAALSRDLTSSEKNELDTLAAKFLPSYIAENPLSAPSITGSDNGSISIGSTWYLTERMDFEEYNSGAYWLDEEDLTSRLVVETTNFTGHVLLRARVDARRTREEEVDGAVNRVVNEGHFDYQKPVTSQMIGQALTTYKNSSSYTQEIESKYVQSVKAEMTSRARLIFSQNDYNSLIELTFMRDDTLANPLTLEVGKKVNVIHKGRTYESILTGKKVTSEHVKLIFGKVRLELTKILKGAS